VPGFWCRALLMRKIRRDKVKLGTILVSVRKEIDQHMDS
jgi:hypothetical protein